MVCLEFGSFSTPLGIPNFLWFYGKMTKEIIDWERIQFLFDQHEDVKESIRDLTEFIARLEKEGLVRETAFTSENQVIQ